MLSNFFDLSMRPLSLRIDVLQLLAGVCFCVCSLAKARPCQGGFFLYTRVLVCTVPSFGLRFRFLTVPMKFSVLGSRFRFGSCYLINKFCPSFGNLNMGGLFAPFVKVNLLNENIPLGHSSERKNVKFLPSKRRF